MDTADILMLSVCIPILLMVGVLVYILLALVLKEEFDKNIWPFNKKREENDEIGSEGS